VTVHSTQLAAKSGVGTGGTVVYTVPSGKRTIVKSIWVRNVNAAAQHLGVQYVVAGGQLPELVIYLAATGSNGDSVLVLPWTVLNAGDQIKLFPSANSVDVIAELSLT
jgi:TolB-like protein